MYFPIKVFNVGSVFSAQEMLFTLAEYVSGTITVSNIDNQQAILQAIQQTLFNMMNLIDGYQLQTLMQQEYTLINRVSGVLPFLSAQDQTLINNRLYSFNFFNQTIYQVPSSLVFDVNQITMGYPAIQNYDLLGYFLAFNAEPFPAGLSFETFESSAQAMATAWLDATNYLAMNATSFQLTAFDAVDRMYYCSQDTDNFIANLTLSDAFEDITYNTISQVPDMGLLLSFNPLVAANPNMPQFWNSLVALPSLLRVAGLLYNDPSSQLSQSINAVKVAIYNLIYKTNSILALFTIPNNIQQPVQSALRQNESILDFAARTTGDYTQWTAIVTANDLVPPYVGIVPAPGIAVPGTKLFLPPFSVNSPLSNYLDAYLGTDFSLGNPGVDFTWSGEFTLIKGLNNYITALQRRVLTPLGTLIYHTNYGSQLPYEVGNVSTASEASLLAGDLKSALLADPRTQVVNQITAYPINFGQIVLTALVTPYGAAAPAPVNLTIIPQSLNTTSS